MKDRYYIVVEGMRGPKRPHETLELAQKAAVHEFLRNKEKHDVYLLKAVDVIPKKVKGDG